jgi:hypothetical protein
MVKENTLVVSPSADVRSLPSLHQAQPPWFDRVLIVFRCPSITNGGQWAIHSRLLHLSFIHFISANAPVLTGQLHRELSPPHWGRLHIKEPGTRNPVFVSGAIEDWAPGPAELDAGNVATWPLHRLDLSPAEDEAVAVGSDPTLLKVKVTWCVNSTQPSQPWIVLCVRLHAAIAGDVGVVDVVRQWVVAHKAEFGMPGQDHDDELLGGPPPPLARKIDVLSATSTTTGATNNPASPNGAYGAYAFRSELPPLYTALQELRERRRTADMRLLRLRYDSMTIAQVVANAVFALREAERQGAAAAALASQRLMRGNLLLPSPTVSEGLCVSLSVPVLSMLEGRRLHGAPQGPMDVLGPMSLHHLVQLPAVCGSPLAPPPESELKSAIDGVLDDAEQLRQLAQFDRWEACRTDRLPGYFLPKAAPGNVDQFEVVVSPILLDDFWKRNKNRGVGSSTTAVGVHDDAYARLDFFRDDHAPPHVLQCPPYAVPHRLVVCSAPARALLPLAAPSGPSGRCEERVSLSCVMDSVDVIVPVPAALVPKMLGVMGLRGKYIGEALPPVSSETTLESLSLISKP